MKITKGGSAANLNHPSALPKYKDRDGNKSAIPLTNNAFHDFFHTPQNSKNNEAPISNQ